MCGTAFRMPQFYARVRGTSMRGRPGRPRGTAAWRMRSGERQTGDLEDQERCGDEEQSGVDQILDPVDDAGFALRTEKTRAIHAAKGTPTKSRTITTAATTYSQASSIRTTRSES